MGLRASGYELGGSIAYLRWCAPHSHSWVSHCTRAAGRGVRCRHCLAEYVSQLVVKVPDWTAFRQTVEEPAW